MSHLCPADFYHKTTFNLDTQNQIWMSQLADGHDNFCDCKTPFGHLLASIFPPGHKDRDLTINQILLRDYQEQCHSGGKEGEGHGMAPSGDAGDADNIKQEEGEEDIPGEELEKLMAAVEEEENTR